ncbi:MAG TPA: Uma2 family endonuclease [Urbifossiella sp.]|nr:Uma2 family endonuclease [Urbifossiella sp.]
MRSRAGPADTEGVAMAIIGGVAVAGGTPPTATDPYFYGWRYVARTGPDGAVVRERVPLTAWDVLHPQEDDFIVHNDAHDNTCTYLKSVFRYRLRNRPGALVLSDHRIDWQAAGLVPHGPDVAVFLGANPWDPYRGTYPVRDEGAHPVLVVEVTSPSTRDKDFDEKVTEYYRAGVPLYVIVDLRPPGDNEAPPEIRFLAYRPSPEGPVRVLPREPNRVWLPELDLWLAAEGDRVVCLEPDGSPVGDYEEVARERDDARADAVQSRVQAAEAEARATAETARASAEAARALEAEARVTAEAAEVQRLRDELAALRARLSAGTDTPPGTPSS